MSAMQLYEKIRLGLLAVSVVSAVLLAAHFGHVVKLPVLEELGGAGSS